MTDARVLLLATTTGYQTRMFADAAARLGVELLYATDRCDHLEDPWRDGAIAVRFHEEWRSVDAVMKVAEQKPVRGIVAVGDRPTVLAAYLSGWRSSDPLALQSGPVPSARARGRR